jgi:hypothetical protein
LTCKFILSDISEKIIASEEGYNIFEPIVALEIDRKNVFESLGINGVKSAVIMHSREQFIETTLKLIRDFSEKNEGAYEYWLLGTGFGFRAQTKGRALHLFLRVNGKMGPTQGVNSPQTVHIGTVSVNEWVGSIASFSRSLSDMFRRLNPKTYHDPMFQKQDASLALLEKWLSSGRNL